MTKRRPDFVQIRLTAEGEAFAHGQIRVSSRHLDYAFKPGQAQEVVERYEWSHVLSRMTTPEGKPVFELVTDDEPTAATQIQEEEGNADVGL